MSLLNSTYFDDIATIFNKHGFRLFMVGGTSRDFLLGLEIADFDVATDATPAEMEVFLPDAKYRFREFGTVSLKYQGKLFEITTLRQEGEYLDYRHPGKIVFVKDPKLDYVRRDFTINALYIDDKYRIYDYGSGLKDLENKKLVMIGDPNLRFKEDPLRMIRALRFLVRLNFTPDEKLDLALKNNAFLVKKINPQKIASEWAKVGKNDQKAFKSLYEFYKFPEITHG